MNKLIAVFITKVLKRRAIRIVSTKGKESIRIMYETESGKAYVKTSRNQIGFLDNAKQSKGEFRKGMGSADYIRWYNI